MANIRGYMVLVEEVLPSRVPAESWDGGHAAAGCIQGCDAAEAAEASTLVMEALGPAAGGSMCY